MLEFSAPVDQHVDITGLEYQSLFKQLLSSGERSAIFELRSSSSAKYPAELSLHFFCLNVGFVGKPWIARVEIPAWVAFRIESVNLIHQALLAQCRLMGTPPYPYLLHRAYEEAVVRFGRKKKTFNRLALELQQRELDLRDTTPTTLEALVQSFGHYGWFKAFSNMKTDSVIEDEDGKKTPAPDSVTHWANQSGVNDMAARSLHSKLKRLFNKNYIIENPPSNAIQDIIEALKKGKHIVLSFGKYESDLDYLLVSNLLTRRIREEWEKMTNTFRGGNESEPRPLVVALEEAHKLLNREMSSQTTFSTIAREMRKYYVTLLVIDQ
ncbi:MAG TPA: DNA double-strand break repair nuclease NurA, partial [Pelolinea sp.]|nr:DNA double-strand break repair nuclease NurA [Pelolinea sp.]